MTLWTPNRRQALTTIVAGLAAPSFAQSAYPSQGLRIVVPFAAGTPPDVTARVIAAKLPELLKQPVIIENKAGATGTIGMSEVARAPADGYTLGALHYATATIASLYPGFKVDITKDFVGVGQIEWGHNILVVSPSLGVNTVPELIALLKKTPGTFGSSGVGSPAHLSGVMLLRAAGVDAAHVPYNNFGQAIGDVASGRVTFMVLAAPAAVPQVQGGRMKALAVTGPVRNPNLKDVPTVSELNLPSMQSRTWSGLVVRSNTPKEIVDRLSRDIATVMAMPDVREQLIKTQAEVPSETVAQFRDLIRRDVEGGVTFVKANNIKID
jgi:tripartite-type tricarboxylate transporter receptor subunit TctC